MGHQFPRNGIENRPQISVCGNCGSMFRRSASRVVRAARVFCCVECRRQFLRGEEHASWKGGVRSQTFSQWAMNQAEYGKWREAVLERDGRRCVVTGRSDDLDVHHLLQKAEGHTPEKVFDVSNGITLNREVHQRIHALAREGKSWDEAVIICQGEFGKLQEPERPAEVVLPQPKSVDEVVKDGVTKKLESVREDVLAKLGLSKEILTNE